MQVQTSLHFAKNTFMHCAKTHLKILRHPIGELTAHLR